MPAKLVGGNLLVAEKVAFLCFRQFVDGKSKDQVQQFLNELVHGSQGSEAIIPASSQQPTEQREPHHKD